MIQKPTNYTPEILGVVSENSVSIGDIFQDGLNKENKKLFRQITEVIEQRKERGIYNNEANRRMWAKVNTVITNEPK